MTRIGGCARVRSRLVMANSGIAAPVFGFRPLSLSLMVQGGGMVVGSLGWRGYDRNGGAPLRKKNLCPCPCCNWLMNGWMGGRG